MGERISPLSFETRQARMSDVARYVMSNHHNEVISNGWTGNKNSHRMFLDITRNSVELAVGTVMAAEKRLELSKEIKKIISSRQLPKDATNKTLAEQLIKELIKQATPYPAIYETVPELNLRRDLALRLAKLDHLCMVDQIVHFPFSPIQKKEMLNSLFRGDINIEQRLEVVENLAAIAVMRVDNFLTTIQQSSNTATPAHL